MAKLTVAQAKAKLKTLRAAEEKAYKAVIAADKTHVKALTILDVQEPKLNAIIWGTMIALSVLIQSQLFA